MKIYIKHRKVESQPANPKGMLPLKTIEKKFSTLQEQIGVGRVADFFGEMYGYCIKGKPFSQWYKERGTFSETIFNDYLSDVTPEKITRSDLAQLYFYTKDAFIPSLPKKEA